MVSAQGTSQTGKTRWLREQWLHHPNPERVMVWVDHAQAAEQWRTWQTQHHPDRPLHLGTIRAWPRRWLEHFWTRLGHPSQAKPHLPNVLGAQWLMQQVLDQDTRWSAAFWDLGWGKTRLVSQLVRWHVIQAETLTLPTKVPLPEVVAEVLAAYRSLSWQRAIFDYGQQLHIVRQHLLEDVLWHKQVTTEYPQWLCDDVEQWPPAQRQILETFMPYIDLAFTYNPNSWLVMPGAFFLAKQQGETLVLAAPPQQELADQLTQVLGGEGVLPTGVERVWVEERTELWSVLSQYIKNLKLITPSASILVLVPREDPLIQHKLQQQLSLLEIPFRELFPEQRLAQSLVGQLVLTVLKWLDSALWGLPTVYETGHLLEFGLGLSPGEALRWARKLHQPLWEPDSDTPAPCQYLVQWLLEYRPRDSRTTWESLCTELLNPSLWPTADQHRFQWLKTLGLQLLAIGELEAIKLIYEGAVLPRWHLPQAEDGVLIASPSRFLESQRLTEHQLWLDLTSEQWGHGVPGTAGLVCDPLLIRALQHCILRNHPQGTLTLWATPFDREGQRQQGVLSRLMSQ